MSLIEAESRRKRGKHRARWAIVEIVVALALVAGTAFAFVGCTIETGDGGSSTTSGGSSMTTEQQTDTTSTESTAGPGSTPSTVTDTNGGDALASPAQEVATKLGPSVVNIAISGLSTRVPLVSSSMQVKVRASSTRRTARSSPTITLSPMRQAVPSGGSR